MSGRRSPLVLTDISACCLRQRADGSWQAQAMHVLVAINEPEKDQAPVPGQGAKEPSLSQSSPIKRFFKTMIDKVHRRTRSSRYFHGLSMVLAGLAILSIPTTASAQSPSASATQPYQVEWVYRVRYGFQDEWWRIFQKYQIAALDEEKRRGYVRSYSVVRPGLHTSEDSRWDYRIVITYNGYDGSTHEGEVEKALFPDVAAREREEDRRWELTLNHWDLPIHEIDPHAAAD